MAAIHTDLWTCPRIAQAINAHFGITYHVDHLGRLLRALGFSPQQPQRKALERDESASTGAAPGPAILPNGSRLLH